MSNLVLRGRLRAGAPEGYSGRMDLRHKHYAVIATLLLIALFAGLLIAWIVLREPKNDAPAEGNLPPPAATTTPAVPDAAPVAIREESRFYEIDAEYPSSTPLPGEANAAAVSLLRRFVEGQISSFKTDANFGNLSPEDAEFLFPDGRRYAFSLEYETFSGPRTVTYQYLVYANTFGAHPNLSLRTFTFDRQTGRLLELSDLFLPDSGFLARLSDRSRSAIPALVRERTGADMDQAMLIDGTAPRAENFRWFRIDGATLTLIFPPYQVGPWAIGTVEVPTPLADLSALLRPEYRP